MRQMRCTAGSGSSLRGGSTSWLIQWTNTLNASMNSWRLVLKWA